MATRLTLTYPLYTRKTASNEEAPLGYLQDGSVIEIVEVVIGKPIDGNNIWYKTIDGVYYWSGGIDTIEFAFPGLDFFQLTEEEQSDLVAQAMEYYYSKLAKKIDGFTGMSVAFKKSEDQHKNYYALAVQVKKKTDNVAYLIPDTLPYHGFAIPTDVIEASQTISNGLGDSLSRRGIAFEGSAAYLTTKRKGDDILLITNYHVACPDLLLQTPRVMTMGDSHKGFDIVMPAIHGTVIGEVVEGRLDSFNDIALIKMELSSFFPNNIRGIGVINGVRLLKSLKENFKPLTINVHMFGGKTQKKTTGMIESFNSTQTISYLNGAFDHVLKGLIQVTRLSQPGDSGSAVVDDKNNLIGVLVGGDNQFSYVLPIGNILNNFQLK